MFPIVLLSILVAQAYGARILAVVPTPSLSHQVVFRPLTQELARRGHEVVIITPDPVFTNNNAPANLTEIDVREVSYEVWRKNFLSNKEIGKKGDLVLTSALFLEQFRKVLEMQLQTDDVKRIIRGERGNFDLLILEAAMRPALVFSHIFKVPVIQVSSCGAMLNSNSIVGAPSHPFLYPWMLNQRLYNLTMWEKIQELVNRLTIESFYAECETLEEEMLRRVVDPDMPSLHELSNNVDLIFYNSHPIWSDKQPVPPNVVYVGGIHKNPKKELPQDLKSYLDSSKNGVIYISFGNNIKPSLLPVEKVQMLARIFSELPQNVLWRWDVDIANKSANVKITQWVPQSDMLRHPNIKLFIMQGGLQSTEEAIDAGVPLIGIPMIADQWYNVEKYTYFGIGKRLDMGSSTEDEFREAIKTVLEDKSYRENVMKLRKLLQDQPESALERAVWWTEYVLRHGGAKHLRSPAANMHWTEYYEIKLLLTFLAVLLIAGSILYSALFYVFRILNRISGKVKLA
ncbi:UDP-glucosyltransferase 2-like [Zerene cesonia]|uniref:UDP-glucosyltransferase 2-like n=1 Tax=Zerene cesonia TaxID=33412 RepID=UPI0018E53C19|nr:UDP-glucosyltransferase 2-like [Zerene cesonia]